MANSDRINLMSEPVKRFLGTYALMPHWTYVTCDYDIRSVKGFRVSVAELSEQLGVHPSTAGDLMKRLEVTRSQRGGYLRSEMFEAAARLVRNVDDEIEPTPEGLRIREIVLRALSEMGIEDIEREEQKMQEFFEEYERLTTGW